MTPATATTETTRRTRASAFRKSAPRTAATTTTAPPTDEPLPPDEGEILGRMARSDSEELRVSVRSYKGREFVDVRIWFRNSEEAWRPSSKGCTIRLRELADFAEAVGLAVEYADANLS